MKEKGGLNILDALENLNTLVDADSLDEIEVTDDSLLIPHKGEAEGKKREIYWMKAGPDDQTLDAIKETFRSVHSYLQFFYKKMRKGGDTKRLVEGINTIMVLVGEAAKNLDNFGILFKSRINEFEEYRQLQNFYRNRVIKETFQDFAKLPIAKERAPLSEKKVELLIDEILPEQQAAEEELQELLGEDEVEEIAGVHILNELDLIKKDHLYELFYLKNEAGHNFYTYELARNIKLACDFGEFAEEYFGEDPLLQIKNWEDKSLNLAANALLKQGSRLIGKFYKEAMKYKEMEVVISLNNALMALMMAANSRNLIRQFSLKGCHLYFHDFLLFLRQALHNREYQKFLIYSPPSGKTFFQDLIDLIHTLCLKLFTLPVHNEELRAAIKQIVERSRDHLAVQLSEKLIGANNALTEAFKKHPSGPVFKAVDIIRDDLEHFFDPLFQGNIPSQEWQLRQNDQEIAVLRMPCPILQEMINKAYVTEEFKTFLRAMNPKEHLLFINYQDRTSWKEHARALAIEELSRQAEFAELFTVVTLAKDTDFYNQEGFYKEIDEAQTFIDHFIQHLSDEITGYYFPSKLKKELFPLFMPKLLELIHKTFFEGKEQLTVKERHNFIQATYHFIELKLIELVDPTYLTLGSKDGLDITATANIGLIALLGLPQKKRWEERESDKLNALLFGATLMIRERVIHPERFERLVSLISLLETKGNYLKEFKTLFQPETLQWEISL